VTDNADGTTPADRVVMVSGGASGIGAEVVRTLAARGYLPVVMDVQEALGKAVADESGGIFLPLDVTDLAGWRSGLAVCIERLGGVFGLVSCAAVHAEYHFDDPDPALFATVLRVNQVGVGLGVQVLGEHMAQRCRGSIVNISSGAGAPPTRTPDLAYAASKWGVRGISRVAAMRLAPLGVRVNTILPGLVDTPMIARIREVDPGRVTAVNQTIPMRRIGRPLDIARAVYFFISELGEYCAGSELLVDGGLGA
jgi:3alpha(or 20beta)-hydroxysteroid dehydrogenase